MSDWRRRRAIRRRAGRSTLARLRREAWAAARRSWQRLLVFHVGWIAVTVVLSAIQRTDFMRGLTAGFMLGLLGLFLMVFLVATGIAPRQIGGSAEQWTAELFERLDPGRWFVAHDVAFDNLNVDHVLIGPGRAYAVETKWTSWHHNDKFLEGARASARRSASKLSNLLASRGCGRTVKPLVVVWGPGTAGMPAEARWQQDGVGTVAGLHADTWLHKLRASGNGLARDLAAEQAITEFINARDAYTAASS